ncbi:hypothetical protein [Chondromyces apiculatus]|nr:hypothetical protein [Chondromyces apiculatus]
MNVDRAAKLLRACDRDAAGERVCIAGMPVWWQPAEDVEALLASTPDVGVLWRTAALLMNAGVSRGQACFEKPVVLGQAVLRVVQALLEDVDEPAATGFLVSALEWRAEDLHSDLAMIVSRAGAAKLDATSRRAQVALETTEDAITSAFCWSSPVLQSPWVLRRAVAKGSRALVAVDFISPAWPVPRTIGERIEARRRAADTFRSVIPAGVLHAALESLSPTLEAATGGGRL